MVVVVLLAAVVAVLHVWGDGGASSRVKAPFEVRPAAWDRALFGDQALTAARYRSLAAFHAGLSSARADDATRLAARVLVADLTGRGRSAWPTYWPPASTTTTAPAVRCAAVRIPAASAVAFPVVGESGRRSTWVKVLVTYIGSCGGHRFTLASPGVDYVYLRSVDGQPFTPVRDWSIPQQQVATAGTAGDLPDWQLTRLGPCGDGAGGVHRLRTMAAFAFDQMCRAAQADGVVLVVDDAYRTRAQQAALFAHAVSFYGSAAKARQWVAYADASTCASRHCDGTAINVEEDHAAVSWLGGVVRCASRSTAGGTQFSAPSGAPAVCAAGTAPVTRAQMFGWVAPVPRIPGYLEFALGDDADSVTADCDPSGGAVDSLVAAVFQCRLARAGLGAADVRRVTAEALVVSRCSSGWDAGARVADGAGAAAGSSRAFTEAGVFALRRELVDAGWVQGDVLDPVVNINAAASLWLATRGWEQFPCATGTDPQLRVGPVLPQYGGPALPAWSRHF